VKATLVWDGKRKEATLTLEQTQVDEKKGVGLFAFDLDLEWVVKGTTRVRTVHLERQKHVVHLGADEAPEFVRIDPRGRAVMRLEFNPGDDPLSRQLREAPDVRGRILAARELCRTGRARNVRAVADAYGKEPFWGVRCRLAEALAEAGTSEAVAALATIVGQEQDPRVLEPLFTAAAKIRDPGLRRALEARLDRGLDLYRAKAALLRALGAQREDAPYERLATAAGEADRYGFVQSGALLALGETRREEALDLLLARLPAGATSNRARPAAAIALGRLARGLRGRGRERAVEALLDALRDPSDRVRKAAVQALATVGDAAAVGPLERAAKGVSDQERVAFERAVERIRKVEKPRVPELEKTVEELATRVRKAEDEIERLRARE
jgi:HEAT repeat protein